MSATPYPIVEIDWLDAQSEASWRDLEASLRIAESGSAMLLYSCGYLLADNDRYLVLAGSYRPKHGEEAPMIADLLQIPRQAVCARRTVRER